MADIIDYLEYKNGDRLLPITHISAVRDSNGDTLPAIIERERINCEEAAEGGTTLSIVTTGEKYNWNQKADASSVYTKTEIDNNIYTKTQIDLSIYTKSQIDTNIYTKEEINNNIYTKTEIDNNIYTKTEIDLDVVKNSEVGVAGGIATLDENGNIPVSLFPDVIAEIGLAAYGVCSTEANIQLKNVIISNNDWVLKVGAIVGVKFVNTNTAVSEENYEITLNVANTGAKEIYYNNTVSPDGALPEVYGTADKHIFYLYNGTYWVWIGIGTIIDTKNTAGSTNSNSKLYIIGAAEQSANPQTYSHTNVYIGTDHCLYSNDSKVLVASDISGKADSSDLTALENAIKYNDVLGTTISSAERTAWNAKVDSSLVGAVNGIALLDSSGKVPSSLLPSYVDDVIEAYYYNGNMYSDDQHTTAITPEAGKIYVDLSTNKEYRWGGSAYAEISASLAIGTTSGTACEGNDPRLSDSRPASDVYAWAKASTKPTYTASEVGILYSTIATGENKTNQTAPADVVGAENTGKCAHVIYNNTGNEDYTIAVSTSSGYKTPDGNVLEMNCPSGGYCEISYLNIGGTIFVRGL